MIIGIVGKPSSGKSTFFKAITLAEVAIAPYPFTTIEKNEGIGYVKVECADQDFNVQCNPRTGFCINHQRFVPVRLIDVAGLVPGAHEGLGMGTTFLDDLRQADVLIHVIDCAGTTNEKGEPTEEQYNPANDIKFLEVELDMWYLQILKKGWDKLARQISQEKQDVRKVLAKQLSALKVTEPMIESTIKKFKLVPETPAEWTEQQLKDIAIELRKLTKPMIIAANKMDIPAAQENINKLKKEFPDLMIVGCSAESELALREAAKKELIKYVPGENSFEILSKEINDKQKQALNFIKENILEKLNSTGVQQVIDAAVFELLKYIAIFPGGVNKLADKDGNVLPDCFLLPKDSTALDFAYSLHTDLGEGFIRAIDVRNKMTVGKEHKLKHRDVIEIIAKA